MTSALLACIGFATCMPDSSYTGNRPAPTQGHTALQGRLREHVEKLASEIGARNVERPEKLAAARDYVRSVLQPLEVGAARVELEELDAAGGGAQNVALQVPGTRQAGIVVVGAHYDSCDHSPGANDNASGVAATLELARMFSQRPAASNLRFILFANEEPPFFKNPGMGSRTSAANARRRGDRITAMLAVETIGFYSDAPDSQHYPWPIGLLYPSRGNFLGFVGDLGSRQLVRESIRAFRSSANFPSQGAALPATFPGIDWSDHWSFRQEHYPAIMVTDTALYRDPNYHRSTDTTDHIDYDALARVTAGLEAVVRRLAEL